MLWCNLWFASFFGDNQECFAFDRKLVPDDCRLKNEIGTEEKGNQVFRLKWVSLEVLNPLQCI